MRESESVCVFVGSWCVCVFMVVCGACMYVRVCVHTYTCMCMSTFAHIHIFMYACPPGLADFIPSSAHGCRHRGQVASGAHTRRSENQT